MTCEGETAMVVLYTSFFRLLEQAQDGIWDDRPEYLYHFTSQPNLPYTLSAATMADCSVDKLEEVLVHLTVAEACGRVSWRTSPLGSPQEARRFRLTLEKAREMGAEIPYWNESRLQQICSSTAYIQHYLSSFVTFGHII